MKNKTLLIAESNSHQNNFIKKSLIESNVNIKILDVDISDANDMKAKIIELNPDLVITNEEKGEYIKGTDIIKEIQQDKNKFQPIFIITSAYNDIEDICKEKEITAYFLKKPYDYTDLANSIKKICNNTNCIDYIDYFENYNFSDTNIQNTNNFMKNNRNKYTESFNYKGNSIELEKLKYKIEKMPKRYKKIILQLEELLNKDSSYQLTFIYQYFHDKLSKLNK